MIQNGTIARAYSAPKANEYYQLLPVTTDWSKRCELINTAARLPLFPTKAPSDWWEGGQTIATLAEIVVTIDVHMLTPVTMVTWWDMCQRDWICCNEWSVGWSALPTWWYIWVGTWPWLVYAAHTQHCVSCDFIHTSVSSLTEDVGLISDDNLLLPWQQGIAMVLDDIMATLYCLSNRVSSW